MENKGRGLAPENETLIQFLKMGSDLVNHERNIRQEMTAKNLSQNHVMDPSLKIKSITLAARDFAEMAEFYKNTLGLTIMAKSIEKRTVVLGRNSRPLIYLTDGTEMEEQSKTSPGLFHMGLKYEGEEELASALIRVMYHSAELYRGAADNGASISFYLEDPEGNGIEIYCDKNPNSWKWRNNLIQINPVSFSTHEFLTWAFNPETDKYWDKSYLEIGHVHLQVGHFNMARRFYEEVLGFTKTLDYSSVAMFAAGNRSYQHFVINSWNPPRGTRPSPSRGLKKVDITVNDYKYILGLQRRLQKTPYSYWTDSDGNLCVRDPATLVSLVFKNVGAPDPAKISTTIQQI